MAWQPPRSESADRTNNLDPARGDRGALRLRRDHRELDALGAKLQRVKPMRLGDHEGFVQQ